MISRARGTAPGRSKTTAQVRVSLASGDGQVAGRAAEVGQPVEAAQVEGRYDVWRADQPVAVHAHQEFAEGSLGPEEMGKDRSVPAERLLPAVRSFANRTLQVGPELPHHVVRIADVAGQTRWAPLAEIGRGDRRVLVGIPSPIEQLQADAGVEQALQCVRVEVERPGQLGQGLRSLFQGVEDPQRHRGEHRLGAPERFEEIEDHARVGLRSGWNHGFSSLVVVPATDKAHSGSWDVPAPSISATPPLRVQRKRPMGLVIFK